MNNKKGLGRGLSELLSVYDDYGNEEKPTKEVDTVSSSKSVKDDTMSHNEKKSKEPDVLEVDVNLIYPNPNQPRKHFDEDSLKDLSESIKLHGVIQPIIINNGGDGKYMIIAGERRYKASIIAGLPKVPAIIKNYSEKQIREVSLIENLQREDLNPIEAGRAIKQLMEEYNFTQEVVADRIGKSRPAIANLLRLLTLSPDVVGLIEKNKLSSGHARCLVMVSDFNDQYKLASQALDNKISVRDFEKIVKDFLNPTKTIKKPSIPSLELKELINEMQRAFSTKVSVIGNENKGRIYIDYYSRDDLDRIAEILEILKAKKLTLSDLKNFNKNSFRP